MIKDISLPIFKKLSFFSITKNDVNNKISQLIKFTKKFFKRSSHVILTKADKENIMID